MSKAQQVKALAIAKPFSEFSASALQALAEVAEQRRYEPGQVAFKEGEEADWAFVVESGRLQVTKRTSDGLVVQLRELRPGDSGGLTAVTSAASRSASLHALEPSTLIALPKKRLVQLAVENPEIGAALFAFLGSKVRSKTTEVATLLARSGGAPREQIVFFDAKPYDEASFRKRLEGTGLQIRFHEARLGPKTVSLADGYPVVCAFVNDDLSRPVLEQLKAGGVELIAMRCAGYNNVDLKAAHELGLAVVRVPAYSPHAVAEHALALILTLNRKTHRAYNRVREGPFSLGGLVGFDLHGSTAGIVGLGKIGRCLAEALRGLGMTVLAYDAFVDKAYAEKVGLRFVSLEELLRESDVVSLHAPLTPATHHLINAERIATMKRGAMLINTSRGGLVHTTALIEALKTGHLGAAGLDVYEEESEYFFEDRSGGVITDDTLARLMTFNNVLVTSHQAFLTEDALDNIAQTTLANVEEYRCGKRGRELSNVVALG